MKNISSQFLLPKCWLKLTHHSLIYQSKLFKYGIKRSLASDCENKSIFDGIKQGPPIEVFSVNQAFNNDKEKQKVNLTIGAFRTNEGKPWVLPVVRKTEIKIASNESLNHEYLPVLGNPEFCDAATELLLGKDSCALIEKRAFGIQSLSGTGALNLGAVFLSNVLKRKVFYYSEPTWENHPKMFLSAGFKTAKPYCYWDSEKRQLDFCRIMDGLKKAPKGAVIIFQPCAHNPTGSDPSEEQWKEIAELCECKKLFPFFDCAYQGFASGDPNKDAWAVRYFVDSGFELFVAQSFAKNFGLYSERIGNLTVVQKNPSTTAAVKSQFTLIVRSIYSNPPAFGSRIVGSILTNPELKKEWIDSVKIMSDRIKCMRKLLREHLTKLGTPGSWDHITKQTGIFSYTGLTPNQVAILIKEYHIYLLASGRINICGANENNIEYIAKSFKAAIEKSC